MSIRARTIRDTRTLRIILTATVVAERGHVACIDTATGRLVRAGDSETLLPIGYFGENATGDGSTRVLVELFEPMTLQYFPSDAAPNHVTEANIGDLVYFTDDSVVSTLATDRSVAGRVFAVDTIDGVGVLPVRA